MRTELLQEKTFKFLGIRHVFKSKVLALLFEIYCQYFRTNKKAHSLNSGWISFRQDSIFCVHQSTI